MIWINFLHLYQPANSDPYNIKEATERSYERLVRALEKNPHIKFTLNISGCLLLRWEELGYLDLMNRIKKLAERGQIEITGTAAYHGLLPLLPAEEVRAQIKTNENIVRQFLGKKIKLRGFFLPEMAYSPAVAKIVKKLGYRWLILDEIAYNGRFDQVNFNEVCTDRNSGLKIVFRSRRFSNSYVPDHLEEFLENNKIVITGTDAELYGLRHEDPTGELEKVLKNKKIKTALISDFIAGAGRSRLIDLVACSWESQPTELKRNKPYILWSDKNNKVQVEIWKLANFSQELVGRYYRDDNYDWARWHLVRGLASCTFWWASGRDFSHNFGPYAWSPDEIERGLNELIRAVRSLHDVTTRPMKIKAEKMYIKIKEMIWKKHWHEHWQK
jgi:predicted glycosyl hydrolase (DUF1957 family)